MLGSILWTIHITYYTTNSQVSGAFFIPVAMLYNGMAWEKLNSLSQF